MLRLAALVGIATFMPLLLIAQPLKSISLGEACEFAQKAYPLSKQRELINQTGVLTVENLSRGFLPQLSFNGQVTYQSEVTKISVPLPGFSFDPLSKDQYKLVAELNQLIYDGGIIREQKSLQQLTARVEEQKLEVELYKLNDRVNQLFLGVLFLEAQLKQVELVKADIQTGIRKVEALVQNGTAFRSNLQVLKAEWLKADQRSIDLKASRQGWVDVLALLTGQILDHTTVFISPDPKTQLAGGDEIRRPELQLFAGQKKLVSQQEQLLRARNLPKAAIFFQGGYGKPGLNFLKNSFEPYYIGGLRFNWSLGGYYTQKREKQLAETNRRTIGLQEETFVLNTKTQLRQQQSEVDRLQQLIATDGEIIRLRKSVTEAARAQLENGVITANDYLREVNAEDQARQALIAHEVQLVLAKINYQMIRGNQ